MSAEGVPVATCPDYEVHVDRMVREGRLGFNDLVRLGEGAWGDGYIAGRASRPALPASTADARVGTEPSKDTLAAMENVFAYMRRMTIQRTSDEAHPDDVESDIYLEGWDQDIVDSLISESRTLMARLDQAMSDDKALALAAKSGGA